MELERGIYLQSYVFHYVQVLSTPRKIGDPDLPLDA